MAFFDRVEQPFKKGTPVLRLKPVKDPNSRWVLWPMFAWRVVAPTPKERKLNLFQRAVLGYARAGVTKFVDMADRLLIAADLAGLVVQELQNMGLLDYAIKPTKRGLKMLEDLEFEPPDEMSVGHVLSDPITGKLWPRFLTGDLPVADMELNEDGNPVLLSGSAGDPWKDKTFCVIPTVRDGVVKARPDVRDVLRAVHRHRRQRDFDEIIDGHDVPRLKCVTFVDDQPQPYFVALRVCRHNSGDWIVVDPFGHGESIDLRAQLDVRLDSQQGLRSWLGSLVGADTDAPTIGQLQIEAAWKVEAELTVNIRQHESVRERLVAMQRALLEVESDDAPRDKWDDVLFKAQKVVERTLKEINHRFDVSHSLLPEKLADSDKEFNRCLLNEVATDLGFHPPPQGIFRVTRSTVKNVKWLDRWSFSPLLVLALLCADREDEHPFRQTGQMQPDLLVRLSELATARNSASHDSDKDWFQKVQPHVDTVYMTVKELLISTHNE